MYLPLLVGVNKYISIFLSIAVINILYIVLTYVAQSGCLDTLKDYILKRYEDLGCSWSLQPNWSLASAGGI